MRVQPSRLLGDVPVLPLFYVGRITSARSALPASAPVGPRQIERRPCVRIGRMLKHTAKAPHARKRVGERAPVVASLVAPPSLHQARQSAPPRARRMCHDWVRPIVAERVARLVPRVDIMEPKV